MSINGATLNLVLGYLTHEVLLLLETSRARQWAPLRGSKGLRGPDGTH